MEIMRGKATNSLPTQISQPTTTEIHTSYDSALALCFATLLTNPYNKKTVVRALEPILAVTKVSRAYVFESYYDRFDGLCIRQIAEVCAENIRPTMEDIEMQCFPLKNGFETFQKTMLAGQLFCRLVKDCPAQMRALFESQDIITLISMPIIINNEWYGFVGFDDCWHPRQWSNNDIDLIKKLAATFGNFFQRQDLERALQESKINLQKTQEIARVGNWSKNFDTQLLEISDSLYRILDLKPHEQHDYLTSFGERILPDDYSHLAAAIKSAIQRRDPFTIDFRFKKHNGELCFARAVGYVEADNEGNLRKLYGTVQDLTENKKIEQVIQENAQIFRFTFEQSPLGGAMITLDLSLFYVNAALCNIVGYSKDELCSLKLADIITEHDCPLCLEQIKSLRLRTVDHVSQDLIFQHKSGHTISVFLSMSLVRNSYDEPLYFIFFVRDITEQKMFAMRLAESEQRHRLIFENSGLGIAYVDLSGKILLINKMGAHYLGYAPEEMVGKNYEELLPHVAIKFRDRFTGTMLSGKSAEYEELFTFSDNTNRWFAIAVYPVRDALNQITGIQVITNDITQQKNAEQKVAKQRLELEHHNIILRNILMQIESEKNLIRDRMFLNIEQNVRPLLKKIHKLSIDQARPNDNITMKYLNLIETYLDKLNDDFFRKIENLKYSLTPHEVRICYLIKSGCSIKELADMLNISPHTVRNHLANIRTKIGLGGKRIGLKSYFNKI